MPFALLYEMGNQSFRITEPSKTTIKMPPEFQDPGGVQRVVLPVPLFGSVHLLDEARIHDAVRATTSFSRPGNP